MSEEKTVEIQEPLSECDQYWETTRPGEAAHHEYRRGWFEGRASLLPRPTPTPTVPAAEGERITLGDHWCDDGWHVVEPDSRRCICGLVGVTAPDLKAVTDPAETEAGTWEIRGKPHEDGEYLYMTIVEADTLVADFYVPTGIGRIILRDHALAAKVEQVKQKIDGIALRLTLTPAWFHTTNPDGSISEEWTLTPFAYEQHMGNITVMAAIARAALDDLHSAEVVTP